MLVDASSTGTMGDTALSTGELANYLGISPQGLHWYEQQGLVQPQKTDSGYRKYTSDDLCALSRIRFYHQCGFTTECIKDLLNSEPPIARTAVQHRIEDMERAIDFERAKLEALKKNEALLEKASKAPFAERSTLEPFWMKKIFESDQGELRPDSASPKNWTQRIPFAHYYSVRMQEDGEMRDFVGIGISEANLAYGGTALTEEIEDGKALFVPRQPAIYAVVAPETTPFIPALLESVRAMGIAREGELAGTVYARPITCHRAHNGIQTYWEAWFPLAR